MTVPTTINRAGPYSGNGVTTEFDYEFMLHNAAHLIVTVQTGDDEPEVLALDVDYTVSGVGDPQGGQFTFVDAPLIGQVVLATRTVPITQEMELQNQGPYQAKTIERAFDLVTMMMQQMDTRLADAEIQFGNIGDNVTAAEAAAEAAEEARDIVLAFENLPIAENVLFTPAGGVTAENTQAAVEQVHGGVVAVANVLEGHITSLAAHSAAAIEVSPVGGIESENVQDALAELDSEKSPVGHNHNGIYARKLASGTLAAASELVIDLSAYVNFSRLELILEGWAPATDQVDLSVHFSTDGGANWLTTGYSYNHSMCVPSSTSGWATGAAAVGALLVSDNANANQRWGNASGEEGDVRLELLGLDNAASKPSVLVHASYIGASGGIYSLSGGGRHSAAAAWNAIRLFFSSGNIARGRWALIGTP